MRLGAGRTYCLLTLLGRCAKACARLAALVRAGCGAVLGAAASGVSANPAGAVAIAAVCVLAMTGAELGSGWSAARADGGSTLPMLPPPPTPVRETRTPAAAPAVVTPSSTAVPDTTPRGDDKPTPEPEASPEPEEPPTDSRENLLDPTFVELSSEASAAAADGEVVRVFSGGVVFRERGAGMQEAVLPMALPSGKYLGAFADPLAGVSWNPEDADGGTLTVHLDAGASPVEMTVRLGPVEGSGLRARADVRWVRVRIGPWPNPLPGSPILGVGAVIAFPAVPPGLWFSMRYVDAGSAFSNAIEEATTAQALGRADVKAVFELSSNVDVDSVPMQIELTLDPAWTELRAPSRLRLAGLAAAEAALFPLAAAPSTPGTARFISPPVGEHSRYAVVLLSGESALVGQPADERGFDWTATALAIIGGLFAATALAVAVRSWRRSK